MESYCTGGIDTRYRRSGHHGLRIIAYLRGGKAKELLPKRACHLETTQNDGLHAVLYRIGKQRYRLYVDSAPCEMRCFRDCVNTIGYINRMVPI
jgi:hypothetical protein